MNCFHFTPLNDFRVVAETRLQFWAYRILRSLGIVVATVGTLGFAAAADGLPGQEQAIALALESHPDIVSAKAKIALAETELYGKRMEVTRQVLGLYGSLKTLDAEIAEAKALTELERMNEQVAGEQVNQSNSVNASAAVQTAERKLVVALGHRDQAERELRLLIGAMPGVKEAMAANAAPRTTRQEPQGSIVETWDAQYEQPMKLSFTDTPLDEVLSFLSDKTGIKFSAQRDALEAAGFAIDMPISISTNEVTLHAALQGLEDLIPELQFVLRDYGVLLTTEEFANEHGYYPVIDRPMADGGSRGGGQGFF